LTISESVPHPNRRWFKGLLTFVDEPSDKAPTGARGHQVLITHDAAVSSLPTLIGMGINFSPEFNKHEHRNKCGVISDAYIDGNKLFVYGFIYGRDFPDVIEKLSSGGQFGMSYEVADAKVDDMRRDVWTISRLHFTGATIVLKHKAAYHNTSFQLLEA
jgi:hypothetical protein